MVWFLAVPASHGKKYEQALHGFIELYQGFSKKDFKNIIIAGQSSLDYNWSILKE
jgi:hypothetical protein